MRIQLWGRISIAFGPGIQAALRRAPLINQNKLKTTDNTATTCNLVNNNSESVSLVSFENDN